MAKYLYQCSNQHWESRDETPERIEEVQFFEEGEERNDIGHGASDRL